MKPRDLVIETVLQKLPLPEGKFPMGEMLWLTVCLEGKPDAYTAARPVLVTLGWLNLDQEENFSGFVNAKKQVQNEPDQICKAIDGVIWACAKTELDFSLIDADTSLEPKGSTFENLFKSPLNV